MNQTNDSPAIAPPSAGIASDARQSMPADDNEISLIDILQVIVDNLRLLVFGPLAAGLLALAYSFTITPTFTATTKFMPPQQQASGAASLLSSLGSLGGLAGAATGIKNPADQYIAFLKSRSLQDALIDRLKLADRYQTLSREDVRNTIGASVQIASSKDNLITIDASATDPAFAAQLANAHIEELGKLLSRLAVTEAQQRRVFFQKQLSMAKDNLVKAEQALKTSNVSSSTLKADPKAAVDGLAKLKALITAQEIKLGAMRGYLTESAPDYRQALTELSAMRVQMAGAEKEETATSVSSGNSDYIAKYRDFKYHETLFELFAKQFEIARVDESREGALIQVIDAAIAPERKSKPKKAQMAMITTLAAGFIILLFIFARQAFRSTSRSPESAEKLSHLRQSLSKALGLHREHIGAIHDT